MTKSTREAAIKAYAERNDGVDWKGLMDYANTMFDIRDDLKIEKVEDNFDTETALKAIKDRKPYLQVRPLKITPEKFREACVALQNKFIESGVFNDDEQIQKLKTLDWSKLTDETILKAGENPEAFYDVAAGELLSPEDIEEMQTVLAGIFLNVLRVYFKNLGEDMTDALNKIDQVEAGDASLVCPTCGSLAGLSSVTDGGAGKSNERFLFCSCCGTVWPFERIRCAFCGNTNSNKLKYVYADEDPAHRMHVCEVCDGAMPTVFQSALKAPLDYDIEQIAMGVLQSVYDDAREEQESEEEKK